MDPNSTTWSETGTNDSESNEEGEQGLLVTDDHPEGGEARAAEPQERDEYDELLDQDPQVRARVKEEMRRLLDQGYQSQQAPQQSEPDALEAIKGDIRENDQWLENFFETPEDQRNYEEYERRKLKQMRLQDQKQELVYQRQQQTVALQNADRVVDDWINQTIRREAAQYGQSDLKEYQNRVRELARNLRPNIRADEQMLRQALEQFVEPNAFKEYQRTARKKKRRPQQSAHGRNDYTDDTPEERPQASDKYSDASEEEREFLRNVGLLKDGPEEDQRGLIPTQDGYVIPVGPGRRNQGGSGQ